MLGLFEDNAPDEELLENLARDRHLTLQKAAPVGQARFQLALELPEVDAGHPLKAVKTGQFSLELALALFASLDRLDQGPEIASLGHGCRQPTQLLVQNSMKHEDEPRQGRLRSQLDRQDRLSRLSTALRIAGIAVLALGVLCFPVGVGVSPKRDLGVFNNLADLGLFWKAGLVLLTLGGVIFMVSFMLPGGDDEV